MKKDRTKLLMIVAGACVCLWPVLNLAYSHWTSQGEHISSLRKQVEEGQKLLGRKKACATAGRR